MSVSPNAHELSDDLTFQRRLLCIAVSLFLTYLTVAIPLPILTVYVTHHLGLSNGMGGLSVGIAFLSTIFSRAYAGKYSDKYGGKRTLIWGILLYIVASIICLCAVIPVFPPFIAFIVLILGRLLVGLGESMTLVGFIAWGLAMAGPQRSGRVMGWIGMGMYGAFAIGSPIGVMIYASAGFAGVMLASALVPIFGYLLAHTMPADRPIHHGERPSLIYVLPRIWKPGMAVALQGIGFAAIGAFITAHFLANHWPHIGMGLSAFGIGFVITRLLCSHLPDRIGGFPVAYGSLAIEAIGQYLLWCSNEPWLALSGALLTGLGCSMVFPSMGLEVVKRVPTHLRGTAMGGFSAFQDLSYGLTGPLVGFFVGSMGYSFAFLIGGLAATLGLLMVWLGSKEPKEE